MKGNHIKEEEQFCLDGGGTNKTHAGTQTITQDYSVAVITVAIGTSRRCGALSLIISDTSPDFFYSSSLLNAHAWSFL